jgi:presenilin-like A22 family membrane protease
MKSKISPYLWSGLVMVLALALSLFIATHQKTFLEASELPYQDTSLWFMIGYFFAAVAIIVVILFILPLKKLGLFFRLLYTLLFALGVFIIVYPILPDFAAYSLAIITGVLWLFWARIWLHDLILLITLAGISAVFGFFISPWTFMIFMLVISVYDVLAVRFGLMIWMADKLSASASLPAFIFPKLTGDWRINLKKIQVGELKKQESEKREYTILGGGDIGFPLMLSVSVFFEDGLPGAILVGAFALVGLMAAFLIQKIWLKGKPMPALPPIAFLSLIGFAIATFFLKQ